MVYKNQKKKAGRSERGERKREFITLDKLTKIRYGKFCEQLILQMNHTFYFLCKAVSHDRGNNFRRKKTNELSGENIYKRERSEEKHVKNLLPSDSMYSKMSGEKMILFCMRKQFVRI